MGGKAAGGTAGKEAGGTPQGGAGGAKGGAGGTGGTGGASGGAGGTAGSGGIAGKGGSGGGLPDGGPDGSTDGSTDGGDACAPTESLTPPTVPAIIKVPDGYTELHHFHATGTQDYTCTASAGANPTYTWSAAVPEAFLFDSCGTKVIQHSAGPTWAWLADGSAIKGTKLQSSDVAGSIPQLLLSAAASAGSGVLTPVKYVQRLATSGGATPSAADCTVAHVNEVQKIAYEATYYFYVAVPTDAGADADSGK
ncbi:MAG TPA: DUF3455 domain-containing protein [Polyangiaceae bacterium]|nr:DUF3455 domain-containing protein [Polyangiaceae bacterium]